MHYKETKYGFEYGAARVDRACSDKKAGWVAICIETPKKQSGITVYVTKTGKVRVVE